VSLCLEGMILFGSDALVFLHIDPKRNDDGDCKPRNAIDIWWYSERFTGTCWRCNSGRDDATERLLDFA
jgi:hypothetical protein